MKMRSGFGGTKRKFSTPGVTMVPYQSNRVLSNRVTKLARKMKVENPLHVYNDSPTSFAALSTTGALYDCLTQITQGDNFNQRFGNKITVKRIILRTTVNCGATQASAVTCRMALVRASYNLVAGRIDNTCISPTANTNILQVYWDKVGPLFGSCLVLTDLHSGIPSRCPRGN